MSDLHWTDLNGKQVTAENDSDKAAALQGFFSSVYADEPDGDFDTLDNLTNNVRTKMSEVVITKDNVYRKLCNLNISKSPGPDVTPQSAIRMPRCDSLSVIPYIQ